MSKPSERKRRKQQKAEPRKKHQAKGKEKAMKKIGGTHEWANVNVNCLTGCSNGCIYCYAKSMARRFGRVKSDAEWAKPKVRNDEVNRSRRKINGTVMLPSTHDLLPEFLEPCVTVLRKLLEAGNRVLVVSKPHLACIKRVCQDFDAYNEQILFRLTIGAYDDALLRFWEPGAPTFEERLASLKFARKSGFRTSISVEPMLDAPNVVELFHKLAPYVTGSIWLGKMNRARGCIWERSPEVEAAIDRIEANQSDDKIWAIYKALKDEPLVRWKESIKEVVGLDFPDEPGMDV